MIVDLCVLAVRQLEGMHDGTHAIAQDACKAQKTRVDRHQA